MQPFYEKRDRRLHAVMIENMKFPEHLHEDMEFLLVEEGEIEVTVMQKRRVLSKGDCAIIFPEQIHSYQTQQQCRVCMLIFGEAFLGGYRRLVQKFYPVLPFVPAKQLPEDVQMAFARLLELNGQGAETETLASAWVHVLLALLVPLLALEERSKSENTDITGRMIQYIMEHYKEQITLESLAHALHVNKYYLSHLFADRLQMGFRRYLNQIRLEHAMYAISTTEEPITRIWEESGFNSQRSFNRIFLEETGMTPLEYRKKHCRGSHGVF